MINNVQIKRLQMHTDERGYFMELLREHDQIFNGFGQWSESLMQQGVIKAWNIHKKQTDYWRVPMGVVRAVLCDMRPESTTFRVIDEYLMGGHNEPILVKIPPGVAHGCKVLQGPALLTYLTNRVYDANDEGRIPYNDEQIGYDWLSEAIK